MEGEKGIVCVTGGTGYIASWMIKRLFEDAYSVHTTIRVGADLNEPDSFDAAIEGCKGVLHVATPLDFEAEESEEALTKRSTNGTLGILRARLKSKTVKRVVYTSIANVVVYKTTTARMWRRWIKVSGLIRISLEKT
ncbi:hypothetical protein PTKIN_Ptkin12aG0074800 [Pterospermum kingtungense]